LLLAMIRRVSYARFQDLACSIHPTEMWKFMGFATRLSRRPMKSPARGLALTVSAVRIGF
jgi:hypothetical protein